MFFNIQHVDCTYIASASDELFFLVQVLNDWIANKLWYWDGLHCVEWETESSYFDTTEKGPEWAEFMPFHGLSRYTAAGRWVINLETVFPSC